MQQLSGLDATFLYLETAEMPMHVGALSVFELPPAFKGHYVVALRKHLQSRLPAAPVLSRRLWWMPLNLANPAWVDAKPDLRKHIVEIKLPASARQGDGLRELQDEVSRLHPVLLDRKRPLWKFHVFEGLAPAENGNRRVAVYSQLHHAAVDGQAAVALANAIMDLGAEPRKLDAKRGSRALIYKLEMTQMLRGVLGSQAQKVSEIVRKLPATLGTLKDAATQAAGKTNWLALIKGGKGGGGSGNLSLAPRTALNGTVTAGRAFAAVSLPLPELKQLGRAHEVTLNDLVLMLCSTALRRYLGKKRQLPRKSLVAAVPISLRVKGDAKADNQASMSLVTLGTHIADPRKRLAHVKAATTAMKSTMGSLKSILPTDFPSLGVPWLMEAATALYGKAKVADKLPLVANLVISNVPGPPVPLYMAGARMLSNFPTSIVVHGLALNITVQSYDQQMDFGIMADAAAMPDVQALADALSVAFDDLMALPRPGESDTDEPLPPGVIAQAAGAAARATQSLGRSLTGRVTGAVTDAVNSVVKGAVSGVVKSSLGGTGRASNPRARAPVKRVSVAAASKSRAKPKPKPKPKPSAAAKANVKSGQVQTRPASPKARRRAG